MLLAQPPETLRRGVIAASTGNHGAAVAFAGRELGISVRVVVSGNADAGKVAAIRALGGEVVSHGVDSAEAEIFARKLAATEGVPFVSPYNDVDVVAGQGTVAVELLSQCEDLDAVYIALGGGGLLAGIAAWAKAHRPSLRIIGCSPENSAVMIHSLKAGRILDLESAPTLSDGTAGGIEPGAITFPWCRDLADELVLVSEAEIGAALRQAYAAHGFPIEGAAAVAIAAYLKEGERWRNRRIAVVICGGNIGPAQLQWVLSKR